MRSILFAVAMATSVMTAPAQAVTLDFEGIAPNGSYTSYSNNGFSQSGFNFTLSHGHLISSTYGSYQANNGTDWLMHDHYGVMSMDMGGSAFSLQSLDFANWADTHAISVTVTGMVSGGGTVSQIISNSGNFVTQHFTNWTNLVSVSFSGIRRGGYDNIVVNESAPSPIPVPATLPLLAGALGVFGYSRRRKNRSVD